MPRERRPPRTAGAPAAAGGRLSSGAVGRRRRRGQKPVPSGSGSRSAEWSSGSSGDGRHSFWGHGGRPPAPSAAVRPRGASGAFGRTGTVVPLAAVARASSGGAARPGSARPGRARAAGCCSGRWCREDAGRGCRGRAGRRHRGSASRANSSGATRRCRASSAGGRPGHGDRRAQREVVSAARRRRAGQADSGGTSSESKWRKEEETTQPAQHLVFFCGLAAHLAEPPLLLPRSARGDVIRLVEELVVQGRPSRGTFVRQGRAGDRGSTTERPRGSLAARSERGGRRCGPRVRRWEPAWGSRGRTPRRTKRTGCGEPRRAGRPWRSTSRAPAQGTLVRQGLPRVRFSKVFFAFAATTVAFRR